ncbi:hypothetical protein [Roseicella aerolata]|uniref:Beta-barrel porin 2 n=1 Tax=Roseicella aerolata TaxID=2883479 RepID=A0A9X1IHQ5_9PROT|nr:hypothetical protein [Roseicella aerolata]MCB4823588.1 hypothetical protein [Roseicella aerolata]
MRLTLAAATLGLLAVCAAPARAQPAPPGVGFPQIAGEANLGLYTLGTPGSTDRRQRGASSFLFGEIAGGLHLSPQFSIQGLLHVEPVGEVEPNGTWTGLRYQGAYIETLSLNWRPTERLNLFGGKFSAPFGYGHHVFPGILPLIRAHETYLIRESAGFGATATVISSERFGEHDLSAAVFTLDTSLFSNTAFTRKPCCEGDFERFRRNYRAQGGAGNTGRLDNFAIALDGDRIGWLPNFSYHLALLSRGPGRDGTDREWGYAAGARYQVSWQRDLRTLFYAEHVEFRGAGGRPLEAGPELFDEDEGGSLPSEVAVSERRRFTTLGAQTTYGPWRANIAWQRDQRKRSVNPVPTASYLEISAGRELFWGFSADIGYQYARYPLEDEGRRGQSNSLLGVLRYRASF